MKFIPKLIAVILILLLSALVLSAQGDSDGDGVPDTRDRCPNQYGLPANNGCPALSIAPPAPTATRPIIVQPPQPQPTAGSGSNTISQPTIDSDSDTVPDSQDLCPQDAGYPEWNGCPDTDGDGLTTQYDQCPDEYGTRENMGCPTNDPTAVPPTLALPVLPEDNCYVGTLSTTVVNIRPDASTDDAPIDRLDPYQPQVAVASSDGWLQLQSGGYVSASVVRTSNQCEGLAAIADQGADDLVLVTDDGDDDYKCVYFRALFQNTGDGDHVLLIHLTDAIGEGSASYIGPALVPEGETYYAEKHFLVPDNWEVPAHPSAGWTRIWDEWVGQFETDLYDFSLIGDVSFHVTFREDCASPQPVCYYTSITVNNPTTETREARFSIVLGSDDIDPTVEESNLVWIFDRVGPGVETYNVPPGETTHNLYVLSDWHYDTGEHLNLQLDAFAFFSGFPLGNPNDIEIIDNTPVEIVPIESLDHLCQINPVELSGVTSGAPGGLAPLPEDLVCYYFEQEYDNLTDLSITSPEFQLVVYHRQSGLPAYDVFPDTFSTTVFSNGDKLQYLRKAPRYELEFGDTESELFITYQQQSPLPDGLVEAGPTLFMIVEDHYCDDDAMVFTHDELFDNEDEDEGITHACYHLHINYTNNTNSTVYITAQLVLVTENQGSINYADPVTKIWSTAESLSQIFTIVAQPPENGYLSYTLSGVDDLNDPGSFSVTYNCPLAQ